MRYKNPLNMRIFDLVVSVLGYPVAPESHLIDLPFEDKTYKNLEEELTVDVRGKVYTVKASRKNKTISDLIHDLDSQYTKNYFQSENGAYKGLIDVTDFEGKKIDIIDYKWKIRGKNLISKIKVMQEGNPGLKILDIGCGYNLYKDYLENVVGVDPYIERADYVCRIEDFQPPHKFDIIICFGPMNWYTFDLQVRNMRKIKECLAEDGICYWSHVHNYYKIYQKNSELVHTWIAGSLDDAFRNNAFYFYEKEWKYNQYFNWTEQGLKKICDISGLNPGMMLYDDCGCYRPPMWRLFCELTHFKNHQ